MPANGRWDLIRRLKVNSYTTGSTVILATETSFSETKSCTVSHLQRVYLGDDIVYLRVTYNKIIQTVNFHRI